MDISATCWTDLGWRIHRSLKWKRRRRPPSLDKPSFGCTRRRFNWSGRSDLNGRPLAPKRVRYQAAPRPTDCTDGASSADRLAVHERDRRYSGGLRSRKQQERRRGGGDRFRTLNAGSPMQMAPFSSRSRAVGAVLVTTCVRRAVRPNGPAVSTTVSFQDPPYSDRDSRSDSSARFTATNHNRCIPRGCLE